MDNDQPPLISGPEPTLLDRLRAAWKGLRQPRDALPLSAPTPGEPPARPSRRQKVADVLAKAAKRKPPRPPRPLGPKADAKAGPDYGTTPVEKVIAAIFIAPWVVILAGPVAADYMGDPYAAIDRFVALSPRLQPAEVYLRALLWQSPLVAAGTFLLRLLALNTTRKSALEAGAGFFLAFLIDGASWLIWGRAHMAAAGFPVIEQKAASDFLIMFGIYSTAIWGLFGPTPRKRGGVMGP